MKGVVVYKWVTAKVVARSVMGVVVEQGGCREDGCGGSGVCDRGGCGRGGCGGEREIEESGGW
jgi:hypothetical protein